MKILAIETTCDDTGIALIDNGKIVFDIKLSSEQNHSLYGGIIPELAARKHESNIILVFKKILDQYSNEIKDLNYIAYASEPGLIGSLHVGKIFAETLALFYQVKIIKVNHIYAHCFSAFIDQCEIQYPFISLIASGGTTSIFYFKDFDNVTILNQKKDDALGEAYDKIGRLLGLPYPGGPNIDKLYDKLKVENIFKKQRVDDDFSFSGAKSKIKNLIDQYKKTNQEIPIEMLASSFQNWAINLLIEKIKFYEEKYKPKFITIGGGVANNSLWRKEVKKLDNTILYPKKQYCCDNASMIAFYAWEKIKNS